MGWTLLASVEPHLRESRALWVLAPSALVRRQQPTPLGPTATATLRLARRLATKHLPFLPTVTPLEHAERYQAWAVVREGDVFVELAEGDSFGLAMLLGVVSLLLGEGFPADLCALASLTSDGRIDRVDGLREKLETVARAALAVRRVIVAPDQEREAREVLATLPRRLALVALDPDAPLAGAMTAAFDDMEDCPTGLWQTPAQVEDGAEELFRLALEGWPVLLRWQGVAAAARKLAADATAVALPPLAARKALWKAAFARDVALRHTGEGVLLDWPAPEVLDWFLLQDRLTVLAHVVQSAADVGREMEAYAWRAMDGMPRPGDRCDGHLRLLGAVGRTFAAAGRLDRAADALDEAVQGWFDLGRGADASMALCELLRVRGLAGRDGRAALQAAEERWLGRFVRCRGLSPASLGFVRLAAGRARVQAGDPAAAVEHLDDVAPSGVDWSAMRDHLRFSRDRWLARPLDATERGRGAAVRERLHAAADRHSHHRVFALLADLDAALAVEEADPTAAPSDVLAAALTALTDLKSQRHEIERHLRGGTPRERARSLAEGYRY